MKNKYLLHAAILLTVAVAISYADNPSAMFVRKTGDRMTGTLQLPTLKFNDGTTQTTAATASAGVNEFSGFIDGGTDAVSTERVSYHRGMTVLSGSHAPNNADTLIMGGARLSVHNNIATDGLSILSNGDLLFGAFGTGGITFADGSRQTVAATPATPEVTVWSGFWPGGAADPGNDIAVASPLVIFNLRDIGYAGTHKLKSISMVYTGAGTGCTGTVTVAVYRGGAVPGDCSITAGGIAGSSNTCIFNTSNTWTNGGDGTARIGIYRSGGACTTYPSVMVNAWIEP